MKQKLCQPEEALIKELIQFFKSMYMQTLELKNFNKRAHPPHKGNSKTGKCDGAYVAVEKCPTAGSIVIRARRADRSVAEIRNGIDHTLKKHTRKKNNFYK